MTSIYRTQMRELEERFARRIFITSKTVANAMRRIEREYSDISKLKLEYAIYSKILNLPICFLAVYLHKGKQTLYNYNQDIKQVKPKDLEALVGKHIWETLSKNAILYHEKRSYEFLSNVLKVGDLKKNVKEDLQKT